VKFPAACSPAGQAGIEPARQPAYESGLSEIVATASSGYNDPDLMRDVFRRLFFVFKVFELHNF